MTTTIAPLDALAHDIRILQSSHVVATVTTQSGSRYTFVVRRSTIGVVATHDTKGWAIQGDLLQVDPDGRIAIRRDGRTVMRTTPIASVYILEN